MSSPPPDPKTLILKTIELIEKHGLPFEVTLAWCLLESMANAALFGVAARVDPEKMFQFIKEWSALSGLPVTDEQLETYKERLREAQERFKEHIEEASKSVEVQEP